MEFWVSGNWSSDYLTKANSLQPARSKAKGNSLVPQPPDYEEFAIVGKVAETRVGRNTWGRKGVEVDDAARRANAHNFILEQEKGYDTDVSKRETSLSGGQR